LTNQTGGWSRNLDKNLGVAGLFGQETLIKTLLQQKQPVLSRDSYEKEETVGEVFLFGASDIVGCWSAVGEFGKGKLV
jgi:hypothetical protein